MGVPCPRKVKEINELISSGHESKYAEIMYAERTQEVAAAVAERFC